MLDMVRHLLDKMEDIQTCKHAARVRWDLNPCADLVDVKRQRCSARFLMKMIKRRTALIS
jgi:hypothetical protein